MLLIPLTARTCQGQRTQWKLLKTLQYKNTMVGITVWRRQASQFVTSIDSVWVTDQTFSLGETKEENKDSYIMMSQYVIVTNSLPSRTWDYMWHMFCYQWDSNLIDNMWHQKWCLKYETFRLRRNGTPPLFDVLPFEINNEN